MIDFTQYSDDELITLFSEVESELKKRGFENGWYKTEEPEAYCGEIFILDNMDYRRQFVSFGYADDAQEYLNELNTNRKMKAPYRLAATQKVKHSIDIMELCTIVDTICSDVIMSSAVKHFPLPIEPDIIVYMMNLADDFFILDFQDALPGSCFDFRLEVTSQVNQSFQFSGYKYNQNWIQKQS